MLTAGVIVAMDKEMALLKQEIENLQEVKLAHLTYYTGIYKNKRIVFTTAGIGKANAAVSCSLMIEYFKPSIIINTGIAGGYDRKLKPNDIVVASKLCYSDVDMTSEVAGGFEYGCIQGMPKYYYPSLKYVDNSFQNYQTGMILSGDQFVDSYEKVEKLVNQYFPNEDVVAFDMESCAVAQICSLNNVDFLSIRAISDIIGVSDSFEYDTFSTIASNSCNTFTLNIIEKIN